MTETTETQEQESDCQDWEAAEARAWKAAEIRWRKGNTRDVGMKPKSAYIVGLIVGGAGMLTLTLIALSDAPLWFGILAAIFTGIICNVIASTIPSIVEKSNEDEN